MRLRRATVALGLAVALAGSGDGAASPSPAATRAALRQEFLKRFARSYYPGRTGQIALVPREGTILLKREPQLAFMHGSPWAYDARIPFLVHGPRFVVPGEYPQPVTQQDMAPTLAALLGVPMPKTATGRPLTAILKKGADRPRLILLAVVDGMRTDYFRRHAALLPTLTRLKKQGAWFTRAAIDYLPTITSLGHATVATGAEPRVHGITGNSLWDHARGTAVDAYPDDSPHQLMALTLADVWNLHTDGRAVIVGQGSVPRGAWPLAGHGSCMVSGRPVAAAAYDEKTGAWRTGPCYRRPEALADQNSRSLWEGTDGQWKGHPIANPNDVRYTAAFSRFETGALRRIIESEPVGADEVTDLLIVNLKTPDYIGHRYGPDSPEMTETLAALDRDLAEVLAALEAKVGAGRYVFAMTADHGMPAEPDGRLGQARVFSEDIRKAIHRKFDPEEKLVLHYEAENAQIFVDRARLRALGLDLAALRRFLEAEPYVFAAYTEDELARAAAALP